MISKAKKKEIFKGVQEAMKSLTLKDIEGMTKFIEQENGDVTMIFSVSIHGDLVNKKNQLKKV